MYESNLGYQRFSYPPGNDHSISHQTGSRKIIHSKVPAGRHNMLVPRVCYCYTKFNSSPLKITFQKGEIAFQPSFFRGKLPVKLRTRVPSICPLGHLCKKSRIADEFCVVQDSTGVHSMYLCRGKSIVFFFHWEQQQPPPQKLV